MAAVYSIHWKVADLLNTADTGWNMQFWQLPVHSCFWKTTRQGDYGRLLDKATLLPKQPPILVSVPRLILNTYKKGIGLKFGRRKYHNELKTSYEELV